MRRRELSELLRGRWWTVEELAGVVGAHPRDVEDDLGHIERSLRSRGERLQVEPARCRKCGFTFRAERVTKPGKCPECRQRWIAPPRFRVDGER